MGIAHTYGYKRIEDPRIGEELVSHDIILGAAGRVVTEFAGLGIASPNYLVVMNGAGYFWGHLRSNKIPLKEAIISSRSVSSTSGTRTGEEVALPDDLFAGFDELNPLVIVEDMIDSGTTLREINKLARTIFPDVINLAMLRRVREGLCNRDLGASETLVGVELDTAYRRRLGCWQ